jgi:hypothetical protein
VHYYSISGLAVGSDIALPGTIARTATSQPSQVVVRRAPVPAALDKPTAAGPTWQLAGERFLLTIPDIARFLLSGGREIAFEAAPAVADADISEPVRHRGGARHSGPRLLCARVARYLRRRRQSLR